MGDAVLMRDVAKLSAVSLANAKIDGQLDMSGSNFFAHLSLESVRVGRDVYMRNVKFAHLGRETSIEFMFAEVGGNLDLSGTTFPTMDLTGTIIHGEFRLGSARDGPACWQDGARLVLRNARVGALQDRKEAWPESIVIDGFTYAHIGGFSRQSDTMATRELSWLKVWLEKAEYSPQPYEQLANIFRQTGNKEKSDSILYTKKQRERGNTSGLHWMGMWLQEAVIGYGFRYRRSLYWVAGLTAMGNDSTLFLRSGTSKPTTSLLLYPGYAFTDHRT